MIIIFGRESEPPRVITGVELTRKINEYFGWKRESEHLGFMLTVEHLKTRYTHIFVIDRDVLTRPIGRFK